MYRSFKMNTEVNNTQSCSSNQQQTNCLVSHPTEMDYLSFEDKTFRNSGHLSAVFTYF